MGILIQGGRIVDAATDTDKKGDIYLEDGVITEIGEKLKIKDKRIIITSQGDCSWCGDCADACASDAIVLT